VLPFSDGESFVTIQIVTCCIVQLETQGRLVIAIINMSHGRFLMTTII